jgi:hypothetical protein
MNRWNAYYFDCLGVSLPPSRIIVIEASDEDQAAKIAISKMGRSVRVHVAQTIWDSAHPSSISGRASEPHRNVRPE